MSLTERLISREGQHKISRSWSWSWSPPKSNRLVLGPTPHRNKKFHRNAFILLAEIHSKMSVCAQSANGKESSKMIQDPRNNPNRHQNLIDSSPRYAPPLQKVSRKSVHNFWRYFVYKKWLHAQTRKHIRSTLSAALPWLANKDEFERSKKKIPVIREDSRQSLVFIVYHFNSSKSNLSENCVRRSTDGYYEKLWASQQW